MAATVWIPKTITPYPPEIIPAAETNEKAILAIQGDTFNVELTGIGLRGYDWVGNGTTTGLNVASCIASCKRNDTIVFPLTLTLTGYNYGVDEKYRTELGISISASAAEMATAPIGTFDYDVQLVFRNNPSIIKTVRRGRITIQKQISS